MRILVCGGRDFVDRELLEEVLSPYRPRDDARETVVIHGGARGADTLADDWALEYGASREIFPAHWEEHGRSAGPIRNGQMLDEGRPDLVIAFPGGRGTADMVRQARRAGVDVMEVGPAGSTTEGRRASMPGFPQDRGTADRSGRFELRGTSDAGYASDDARLGAVCEALCASGRFETGQGGCAPICMEMLGCSRPWCSHKTRVHGELARSVIRACDGASALGRKQE